MTIFFRRYSSASLALNMKTIKVCLKLDACKGLFIKTKTLIKAWKDVLEYIQLLPKMKKIIPKTVSSSLGLLLIFIFNTLELTNYLLADISLSTSNTDIYNCHDNQHASNIVYLNYVNNKSRLTLDCLVKIFVCKLNILLSEQ